MYKHSFSKYYWEMKLIHFSDGSIYSNIHSGEKIYNLHGQKFTEFLVVQNRTYELVPGYGPVHVTVHLHPGVVKHVILRHVEVEVRGPLHHSGHVEDELFELTLGDDAVIVNIKYSKYLQSIVNSPSG